MQDQNEEIVVLTRGKRKAADNSPLRNDKVKRSALGNLTDNVITTDDDHRQGLKNNIPYNQKVNYFI